MTRYKMLLWNTGIPENEVWVKVGGDKGGGTFKMCYQVCMHCYRNDVSINS